MTRAEIIVVAPDVAFRHSLVFVLESGGFAVLSLGALDSAFESASARKVGCAVVDEEAIHDWPYAKKLFRTFARPVILLVDHSRVSPGMPSLKHMTKPFLGEPLLQAVEDAIAETIDPDT